MEDSIITRLFYNWELDTWANVLEIVGFGLSIISLIIALIVKSEIKRLKQGHIFSQRFRGHLKNLTDTTTQLNSHFNDYDSNINLIKVELSKCVSELQDLKKKIDFWDSFKVLYLIWFIKSRMSKKFELQQTVDPTFGNFMKKYLNRAFKTTYDDIWIIYFKIHEVTRQIENIKKNKDKAL